MVNLNPFVVRLDYSLLILVLVICSLITAFQFFGLSNDYEAYYRFFRSSYSNLMTIEPTAKLFKFLAGNSFILFISFYAVLSAFFKGYTAIRYSDDIYLTIIVFLAVFYLLHDYTQWRASVAISLTVLAVCSLSDRGYLSTIAISFLATLFHYSAIVVPLFLISFYFFRKLTLFLPLIGILLVILKFDISGLLELVFGDFKFVYNIIQAKSGHSSTVKVLTPITLPYFITYFVVLYKRESLNKLDTILFSYFSFGLFLLLFLSLLNLPVITYRIFEFICGVLIILLPNLVKYFKYSLYYLIFIFIVCFINFAHLIFNVIEFK